tara:strand:+ start:18654 stop:18911 length:258 start_codon:yes stop_codon:yes gene_type:complete
MRILVDSEDIAVLSAALGIHDPEEVWWYTSFTREKEGINHGLLRGRVIPKHQVGEEVFDMGWDKVRKAMPRSMKPSNEGGSDESE